MNIGVVGSGKVGVGWGEIWARHGHAVCFSYSRDPETLDAAARAAGPNATICCPEEAAQFGDIVLLALPWALAPSVVMALRETLEGKTLLTCVVPWRAGQPGLSLGPGTSAPSAPSAAEEIARLAPGAHVVEALPLLADLLSAPTRRFGPTGADRPTVFYCGDEAGAKADVAALLEEADCEAVDAGLLTSARYLEPTAALLFHLALEQGEGTEIALKLLRR
jgi:predicted dinucleotide-binding enzyme